MSTFVQNLPFMNEFPPEFVRQINSFYIKFNSLHPFLKGISSRLKNNREIQARYEARFKKLLEKSHDGLALLRQDGKITYVTPAVLQNLGYTEQELVNNPNELKLGHPDEREMIKSFIEDMFRSPGKTKQIKFRVRTKAGAWKWMSANVTNLIDDPNVGALVFNYEDITDKVNLELEREIELQNRDSLINSTSDLMWSLDKEMRLVTCNLAFEHRIRTTTGIEVKKGDTLLNPLLYSADKVKKWKSRYLRALNGESFVVDDFFDLASNERWEETRLNPIYKDNEIIGASCFLRDITEKKIASEIIRKSEENMSVAQSISHFGSWECYFDEEGNVRQYSLKWSDELYRICGYEPGGIKLSYEFHSSVIHEGDKEYVRQTLHQSFVSNTIYECEYRIVRKDGEVRWVKSIGRAVLKNENKPLKMVGTTQDITERKLVEMERNKLINDLIQKNKDLEQFAYIVSHNLRAPVAQILGLVKVFRSHGKEKETQLKCAEGLEKSTQALDSVIVDLNEILQIKKQIGERKTLVNFTELVKEVHENLSSFLQKENGTIKTDFALAPELFTLKGYLYSIFYNLILNSIKYRKHDVDPVIHIRSELTGNRILLSFSDNGTGIDLKLNREKIFGLYKRFTNHVEGKGVGLYMVKTQVETLGGKISVESELNEGTTFKIEFEIFTN